MSNVRNKNFRFFYRLVENLILGKNPVSVWFPLQSGFAKRFFFQKYFLIYLKKKSFLQLFFLTNFFVN